jgi:hypothetical protein
MDQYQGATLVVYIILSFILAFGIPAISKTTKKQQAPAASHVVGSIVEYNASDTPCLKERDELIFDLVKRRYDGEIARWDGLDSKAGSLIGFFSIVTSLTLAAGSFNIQNVLSDVHMLIGFFFGIAMMIISIGFSLMCFRVRLASFVPNTAKLCSKYGTGNVTYRETLRTVCGQMSVAVVRLEATNNSKGEWIQYSWTLFVIALGYLFILLIMFTMSPQ